MHVGCFNCLRQTRDSMAFVNYDLIDRSLRARFRLPLALFQAGAYVDVFAFLEFHCDIR